MGQIWAARRMDEADSTRLFAVKTMLPRIATVYRDIESLFREEARIATAIDHPGVCRTYELGEDGDILFLAMEWVDGASLAALVSELEFTRQRFDFGLAAYVVAQACAGLHAVHELTDDKGARLNAVHRDATPHNILISSTGDVKLIDFGVVKARGGYRSQADANELKGKIAYLSPEQLLSKQVDRRTDLFALGCVLYYVSTGRRAFNGNTPEETMRRIAQGEYLPPSWIVRDYPAALEAIVVRALAVEPDDRFRTAEHMREALECFIGRGGAWVAGRSELARVLSNALGAEMEERRNEIRLARQLFSSAAQPSGRHLAPRSTTRIRPVAEAPRSWSAQLARVVDRSWRWARTHGASEPPPPTDYPIPSDGPLSAALERWQQSLQATRATAPWAPLPTKRAPSSNPTAPDLPARLAEAVRSGVVVGKARIGRKRVLLVSAVLACVLGPATSQDRGRLAPTDVIARPATRTEASCRLDVHSDAASSSAADASAPPEMAPTSRTDATRIPPVGRSVGGPVAGAPSTTPRSVPKGSSHSSSAITGARDALPAGPASKDLRLGPGNNAARSSR